MESSSPSVRSMRDAIKGNPVPRLVLVMPSSGQRLRRQEEASSATSISRHAFRRTFESYRSPHLPGSVTTQAKIIPGTGREQDDDAEYEVSKVEARKPNAHYHQRFLRRETKLRKSESLGTGESRAIHLDFSPDQNDSHFVLEKGKLMKVRFRENHVKGICHGSTSTVPSKKYPKKSREIRTPSSETKAAIRAPSLSDARSDQAIAQDRRNKDPGHAIKSSALGEKNCLASSCVFKPSKGKENMFVYTPQNAKQLKKIMMQPMVHADKRDLKTNLLRRKDEFHAMFSETPIETRIVSETLDVDNETPMPNVNQSMETDGEALTSIVNHSKNIGSCIKNVFQEVLQKQVCEASKVLNCGLPPPKPGSYPTEKLHSLISRPQQPLTHFTRVGSCPAKEPQACPSYCSPRPHRRPQRGGSARLCTSPAPSDHPESEYIYCKPVTLDDLRGLRKQPNNGESMDASQMFPEGHLGRSAVLQRGQVTADPIVQCPPSLGTIDEKPELNVEEMGDTLHAEKTSNKQELSRKKQVSTKKQRQEIPYCNVTPSDSVKENWKLSPHLISKTLSEPKCSELASIASNLKLDIPVVQIESEGKAEAEDQKAGTATRLKTATKALNIQYTKHVNSSNVMKVMKAQTAQTSHVSGQAIEREVVSGEIKIKLNNNSELQIHLKVTIPDKIILAKEEMTQTTRFVTEETQFAVAKEEMTQTAQSATEETQFAVQNLQLPLKETVPLMKEKPANWVGICDKIKKPLPRYRIPTQSSSLREGFTSQYLENLKNREKLSPRYFMMNNKRKRIPSNLYNLRAKRAAAKVNQQQVIASQLHSEVACGKVSQSVFTENVQSTSMAENPWQLAYPKGCIAAGATSIADKSTSMGTMKYHSATPVRTSRTHVSNSISSSTWSETESMLSKEHREVCSDCDEFGDFDCSTVGYAKPVLSNSLSNGNLESEHLGFSLHEFAVMNASYDQQIEKLSLQGKHIKSSCHTAMNEDDDDCSSIARVKKLWRSWMSRVKTNASRSCSNTHMIATRPTEALLD